MTIIGEIALAFLIIVILFSCNEIASELRKLREEIKKERDAE